MVNIIKPKAVKRVLMYITNDIPEGENYVLQKMWKKT